MSQRLAIAAALSLLALTLGACGSGGDDSTQAASTTVQEAGPRVVPMKVSGGGSAQFRVKGADNSIQDYGSEAPGAELRQAARVVHGYFAALAREEWARACSHLSRKELGSLERLAAASPKLAGKGCAATLAKLFGQVSAAEGREATVLDAVSLRRRVAHGFLIYRGAGGTPYFVSLTLEEGGWALAGLSPTGLG